LKPRNRFGLLVAERADPPARLKFRDLRDSPVAEQIAPIARLLKLRNLRSPLVAERSAPAARL
jgi:hypothetical protein